MELLARGFVNLVMLHVMVLSVSNGYPVGTNIISFRQLRTAFEKVRPKQFFNAGFLVFSFQEVYEFCYNSEAVEPTVQPLCPN
jgi:hypothetical protein